MPLGVWSTDRPIEQIDRSKTGRSQARATRDRAERSSRATTAQTRSNRHWFKGKSHPRRVWVTRSLPIVEIAKHGGASCERAANERTASHVRSSFRAGHASGNSTSTRQESEWEPWSCDSNRVHRALFTWRVELAATIASEPVRAGLDANGKCL